MITITMKRVNFDFKLTEIYNEEDVFILILLGKLRIKIWKDWKINGY